MDYRFDSPPRPEYQVAGLRNKLAHNPNSLCGALGPTTRLPLRESQATLLEWMRCQGGAKTTAYGASDDAVIIAATMRIHT
ncbi:hypothetical protein NP233_g10039 [Leucocoprinus birnbaumii]|uniref:Uncharacterized protein n=1 Tax=Leucocoprinus birnbaumii TaxID=56174 RepID=A0AAD5VMQ8_9AGAR|nr:hypothetical protein NP233_g10039 [Leucocoprinus birnbaumii]